MMLHALARRLRSITFALAFSVLGWVSLVHAFEDVSVSNRHYVAISTLVEQGVIQGYDGNVFRPDQFVNRAEALKIILSGLGVTASVDSEATLSFSDVRATDWFFEWVQRATSLHIIKGYSDGTFKPGQNVTRAEAMKIALEASGLEANLSSNATPFPDIAQDDWFAPYASFARQTNAVPPQTDGLWHPQDPLTRGELAELVYRLQSIRDSGQSFDEARNWGRVDFPTVDISMKIPFGWWTKQDGVGSVFLMDTEHGQLSLLNPEDNGGTLLMTRYANYEDLSEKELFNQVRASYSDQDVTVETTPIGQYSALVLTHEDSQNSTHKEWYIALPNGTLLHLMALRGNGAYAPYLDWYFDIMVGSVEWTDYSSDELTRDEILEQLRNAIQVDGVGSDMKALVTDWELFETDAIGVGTGPVDYFYSPSLDITLKYERSFDVILDLRSGQSSAF